MNQQQPIHRRRLTRAEIRRRRRNRAIRRIAGLTLVVCVAVGGVSFLLSRRKAPVPTADAAGSAANSAASSLPSAAPSSKAESSVVSGAAAESVESRDNLLGLTAAEAKAKRNEYDAHTSAIEAVRREIMGLLASVKMPLEGLTVKDTLLYYKGQRWDCMSGAEQLIVATSIVRAVNPNCGFVLMDKLEAMDLATLSEFNDWLLKENLQVIATRVSQGDECSIIIEDGSVAE